MCVIQLKFTEPILRQKTETMKTTKEVKLESNQTAMERPYYVRREASLNASAVLGLLYRKEEPLAKKLKIASVHKNKNTKNELKTEHSEKTRKRNKSEDNGECKIKKGKITLKKKVKVTGNKEVKSLQRPITRTKRMASLNAAAILAATSELEKESKKCHKKSKSEKTSPKKNVNKASNSTADNTKVKSSAKQEKVKADGFTKWGHSSHEERNLQQQQCIDHDGAKIITMYSDRDQHSRIIHHPTPITPGVGMSPLPHQTLLPPSVGLQLQTMVPLNQGTSLPSYPYQSLPQNPVVPVSQCQSMTLGGLGSISNLGMMYSDPPRNYNYTLPSYGICSGYYQPAGPLIQSLPHTCMISHPTVAVDLPQILPATKVVSQPNLHIPIIPKQSKQKCHQRDEPPKKKSRKSSHSDITHSFSESDFRVGQKKTSKEKKGKSKPKIKLLKVEVEDIRGHETVKKMKKKLEDKKKKVKREAGRKKEGLYGWWWHGEPVNKLVYKLNDLPPVERKCYPAIRHEDGDLIKVRDCVLLRAGSRESDLPYIAKVTAFWEQHSDGEMMMSLLWYYRPEHTEMPCLHNVVNNEIFASKHYDENSIACIDDKCYVLTPAQWYRYKARLKRIAENIEMKPSIVPEAEDTESQKTTLLDVDKESVFLCRKVYDFKGKRLLKNPS